MIRTLLAALVLLSPITHWSMYGPSPTPSPRPSERMSVLFDPGGPGHEIPVTFPDKSQGSFEIDTGSDFAMVDEAELDVLSLRGYAHMFGMVPLRGVDDVVQQYPLFSLDRLTVGSCTIVGTPDDPIVVAGGYHNLLGATILSRLGTYSISDSSFIFDCPK